MIDFLASPPNSSLYSWMMSILCFVPVTITSSLTGSEGMDRSKSLLAKADATFTFSKDTDADAVVMLCRFIVRAAIAGVGTCVLMTRFLFTLSLIFWWNEQVVHVGFGGKVGRGLVTVRRINSKGGEIRQQRVQKTRQWHVGLVVGFNSLFSYCWVSPCDPPIMAFTSAGNVVSVQKW